MANKNNKIAKQNKFLKGKLTAIVITYSIFASIIFILALLKKYSVISSDFFLIIFYFIMASITTIIIVLLYCQIEKVFSKKEILIATIINLIGIFILVAFGIAVDIRSELIDFSKNATKTEALVYKDVEKEIDYYQESCSAGIKKGNYCYSGDNKVPVNSDYYKVLCIYHLKYTVDDEIYTSIYRKQEGGKFDSEQDAKNFKSKYQKGDYITIYYDNDNPEEVRENFALGFGIIYFFEIIAILFQFYYFIKHRKLMKEVIK